MCVCVCVCVCVFMYTHREVVNEFDHIWHVSDDEGVETGHEWLFGLELHQVGKILNSLCH